MIMTIGRKRFALLLLTALTGWCGHAQAQATSSITKDIRKLSQHLTDPKDMSPWVFAPQDNIKALSTTEHPGFVTVWHGSKGEDIKGVLKEPIKIDDYPLPWEFHLGFAQFRSSELPMQCNYAIGLNLAVTFSDPSTWPQDRSRQPPDTHSFQLLDAHLKIPQLKPGSLNYDDPGSEAYLVYGRGDLAPNAVGNWKIPYIWTYSRNGGPASFALSYRLKLVSPTKLEVGFFGGLQGEPHPGWRMKTSDVSRFGRITGIWEIGPIISLDRWIPDSLAPELGLNPSPPILTSDPSYQYYTVDYAVFFGAGPKNLDDMSDDFDVPGFQAKWYHEGSGIVETYSHPGYLTVTLPGPSLDGWAMCPTSIGGTLVDLSKLKPFPGYEIEISFIPPDDSHYWNFFMSSFGVWDETGKQVLGDGWQPGVQNFPAEKRHRFINVNVGNGQPVTGLVNVEFEKEIPESILAHTPVYMLVQVLDSSHLRVGLKANKTDDWYLSKAFDTSQVFGKIGKFNPHPCFTAITALKGQKGWGTGNFPGYQQFLIDYVHFRYGLSISK
jgi:hypothetical protein